VIAEETLRVFMFLWRYRSGAWFKLEPAREVVHETAIT
jgi:Na+-driven multidrug efflux pump